MLQNKKIAYFIYFMVYIFFLFLIYKRTGIISYNEAEKYILAAKELSKGNIGYTLTHYLFYCSYIFFVTLTSAFGGFHTVIIAQAILTFYGSTCLYKTIQLLTGKESAAHIGMLLFLFSFPIQSWVVTLFSDTFFVALIVIALYLTVKQKTKVEFAIWISLLIVLIFARPPGIFLSITYLLYFLSEKSYFKKKQLPIVSTVAFFLVITSLFILPVSTNDYIKPVASGAIIIDQPYYNIPQFDTIDKSNMLSAYDYLYDKYGSVHIISLYLKKLVSFFTLTRPYYSNLHNSVMTIHYFLYVLSIMGFFMMPKKRGKYILLISILLLANLTAITFNEWHYRFTITIFPFLIILSSIPLARLIQFFRGNRTIS